MTSTPYATTAASLCLAAYERLITEGVQARVVSMPSWELFERQSQAYRDQVITARISVEQAAATGWDRYIGLAGASIGMNHSVRRRP